MGLEFELLCGNNLPPIRTPAANGDENAVDGCATPTSVANVVRAPAVCPPAPRKPRPAKRKLHHLSRRQSGSAAQQPVPARRWFIAVPYDVLAAAFVARPASACRPPAGKKIRVHIVG
ncbi:hypothetical protein QOZ80_2AG0103430 [Eleusine coracana subsp. coracana]|nr:hypothetical protein QOZ80_2AG0103430 [Eleusine coracana subsp. coracana]